MIETSTKVLLVDDLALMRAMLKKGLVELGITSIEEASDGLIAMEKIRFAHASGQPYGAVFLDWNMPNKTGYDVLIECRKDPNFKSMTIIMVTAEAEKKNVIRALSSGATDYIVKPCSPAMLKLKIEHVNSLAHKRKAV